MAIDLGGPSPFHLGTTSRPGDTRPASALDTWFMDCLTDESEDGTEFASAIFNEWLAWMRSVARANGNTGGGSPVVAEVVNDDALLLNAIRHLTQRGLQSYAVDSGTADALVVTLTPALAEYKAGGQPIWIKKGAAANATPTPTVDINGRGAKTIVNIDGTALDIGQLAANGSFAVVYDGTNMRITSAPRSATKAEVEGGVLQNAFVSPATLFSRRVPYFFASGSTPQGITNAGSDQQLTGFSASSSYFNSGSGFASSTFTCGTKDAGAWLFFGYAAMEMLTAASGGKDWRLSIALNGTTGPFESAYVDESSTYGKNVMLPLVLANGDTVSFKTFQSTGATRNVVSRNFVGFRIAGAA